MNDQLTIALRFALFTDLLALFGWAAFALYGPREADVAAGRAMVLVPWAAAATLAGLLLSGLGLVATAASMADVPLGEVDREAVRLVLFDTSFGIATIVRCASLAAALATAFLLRKSAASAWIATAAFGIAAGSLAWGGHGVMDDGLGGWIHLAADAVHLLAAGLWIGGLLRFSAMLFAPRESFDAERLAYCHRALAGFAPMGTILVATIGASGLVNAWFVVGPAHTAAMWTTGYGLLLAAKVALFLAMMAIAAANRFRLTPALARAIGHGGQRAAVHALRRSLAMETGSGLLILAIVAWLGTLEPPATIF